MSKSRDANGFIRMTLGSYLAQLDCQGTFVERKTLRTLRRILQKELSKLDDLETLDCWQEEDHRRCIRKDGAASLRLIRLATETEPEDVHEFESRHEAAEWIRSLRYVSKAAM